MPKNAKYRHSRSTICQLLKFAFVDRLYVLATSFMLDFSTTTAFAEEEEEAEVWPLFIAK